MSICFSWLLDPRLHLTLIISVLASVVADDRWASKAPASLSGLDSHFNEATLVIYEDGTTSRQLARLMPEQDGLESVGSSAE